jgi:hypothetical protein
MLGAKMGVLVRYMGLKWSHLCPLSWLLVGYRGYNFLWVCASWRSPTLRHASRAESVACCQPAATGWRFSFIIIAYHLLAFSASVCALVLLVALLVALP